MTTDTIQPIEAYQFNFSKEELSRIQSLQRKELYKKTIIFSLLCIISLIIFIFAGISLLIGFDLGVLFLGLVTYIKSINAYNKVFNSKAEKICKATYEYKVFDNYFCVSIYRENEKKRESKCYFSEIEQIQLLDNWLFLQFDGQAFFLRKNDLKENSVLFSCKK